MMANQPIRLGVNLDHVAALRQARRTPYPDLVEAIKISEQAGADGITLHLREDRRHIQTEDIFTARRSITTTLNMEMAATDEMVAIALEVRPDYCCIVPERREELTTEGGLNLDANQPRLRNVCQQLAQADIKASLFIEPTREAIEATAAIGAPLIELHTGAYADAAGVAQFRELERLREAAAYAAEVGLQVNAGHGLHRDNAASVASISEVKELNIGHAIVARALFVGIARAVAEMKQAMSAARAGI